MLVAGVGADRLHRPRHIPPMAGLMHIRVRSGGAGIMVGMKCYICGSGSMSYPAADAVAWIRTNPAGNIIRLCERDLDHWFDDADNDTVGEPLEWGWGLIARPPASRRLTLVEQAIVERTQIIAAELHDAAVRKVHV